MTGEPPPTTAPEPVSAVPAVSAWQRIRQHKMLEWGLGYLGAALAIAHGAELVWHTFGGREIALLGRIPLLERSEIRPPLTDQLEKVAPRAFVSYRLERLRRNFHWLA